MVKSRTTRINSQKIIQDTEKKIYNLSYHLRKLTLNNKSTDFINHKIYHLLCRPYTFINAYSRIVKNKGSTTKGIPSDEEMLRIFSIRDANRIARKFRNQNYKWKPTRRTWIPKPGKTTKRPIDTPTQEDRIVQEAIRGILESIFEPEFQQHDSTCKQQCSNFGFRPNKSCWDAVEVLKIHGQRTTYAIEGDIVGAYNNVNHDILLKFLKQRITDQKFLKVIHELLKSGIMENNKQYHSLIGTPQGGIVSPLLFNIYMFSLDKFIFNEFIKPNLKRNEKRNENGKRNKEHAKIGREIRKLAKEKKNYKNNKSEVKRIQKQIKNYNKQRFSMPSKNIETLPKSIIFTRYADDWVLLITGSKRTAQEYKEKIQFFIKNELNLELDINKTTISRLTDGFKFLGFSIKMNDIRQNKIVKVTLPKNKLRFKRRSTSRKITIIPDKDRILMNLKEKKFCNSLYYPIGLHHWTIFTEYEIVQKYDNIFRGLFNYYSNCDQNYILNRVYYILQYSCAKTIATRKKITMSQVFSKYSKKLNVQIHIHKNGESFTRHWYLESYIEHKLRKLNQKQKHKPESNDPFKFKNNLRTSIKVHLNCCICNSDQNICMHHTNSLRAIKKTKDSWSYILSCLNRQQINICHKCHIDITHGRYNKENPVKFYNEFLARL